MINDKIKAIYDLMASNDEIGAKLAAIKSPEEAVTALAEHGISVSVEELKEMLIAMNGEELPVEMLELVAGGGKVMDFFWGFFDGLSEGWNNTKEFFGGLSSKFKKK